VEGSLTGAGEIFRRLNGQSPSTGTPAEILSNSHNSVELFSGNNQKHPARTAGSP
jgi:hypothetical protein